MPASASARSTAAATPLTRSRVSVLTFDSGPRTATATRSTDSRNPVKPDAAAVIGTPESERSTIAVTSPAMRTSLGTMRTMPSGAVSSGTVRKKGPFTLEMTVGSVVTESIRARLFSGPMTRAMLGVMDSPRITYPDSASTRTRATIRTSLCTTESSITSTSRGRMSATWTSLPLGSSTSVGCSCTRHAAAEKVSGMTLRITRGKVRSLRISLPLPVMTTVTPAGCWRTVRPGGTTTASRMAKLCASGCCAATATYNMAAKKPAASLIGQLRTSSCPTLARTLIHEPPDEGFVDRAVPLGGPDHLLDDHAVGADDPGLGDARGLVRLLDGPRLVVQDVEAEPQVARERGDDRVAVLVDAHRHDREAAAPELAGQPLERWHLDPARLAPRRPEIQQHHPAAIVRERGGAPGGHVPGVEIRRPRSDAEQVDLGTDLHRQGGPE